MRNHIFYRINTYQLSMRKMYNLGQVLNQMPIVYLGYKSLDDYVANTTRLVTCKNNMFQVSRDPVIHFDIQRGFNKILNDEDLREKLDKNSQKTLMVSYRITNFLIDYTVTSRDK